MVFFFPGISLGVTPSLKFSKSVFFFSEKVEKKNKCFFFPRKSLQATHYSHRLTTIIPIFFFIIYIKLSSEKMVIHSYLQLDEAEKYKFHDDILHATKHRLPRVA